MASSRSSGIISADTLLWTGVNRINALTVFTDGVNTATVLLRDGTTVAATPLVQGVALGSALQAHYLFDNPVYFENGIYIDIGGVGATCIVYYGG